MIKHLMELITKVATLPFTESMFLNYEVLEGVVNPEGAQKGKQTSKKKDPYKVYRKFQEEVNKALIPRYRINQMDQVNMLVQQYFPMKFFRNCHHGDDVCLNQLQLLSQSFIAHRNSGITFKYWQNENDETLFGAFTEKDKVELWNILSRQMCVDLLVVNYLLDNNMNDIRYLKGYYWLINLRDLQVEEILNKGVAENHLHVNAGNHFYSMWEELMKTDQLELSDEGQENSYYNKYTIMAQEEQKNSLFMASIMRLLMHHYLVSGSMNVNGTEPFLCYIKEQKRSGSKKKTYRQLDAMRENFIKGEMKGDKEAFKSCYYDLLSYEEELEKSKAECIDTTKENIFLFRALKYIKEQRNDVAFTQVFWNYIRVKNIIYEQITQGNQIQGLQYFQGFFSRGRSVAYAGKNKKDLKEELERQNLKKLLKNQIYNNKLKKLELRVGISSDNVNDAKKSIIRTMKQFLKVYLSLLEDENINRQVPKMGIVIHFKKDKDEAFFEKCWCASKGIDKHTYYFYGQLQHNYMQVMEAIRQLRDEVQGLSHYIVGIDAASAEHNAEPWVFAPIYQKGRDSKEPMWLTNQITFKQNLGFTFHVGEDFRHVISGLRHIDEVVEYFGYHAGDRIGHGVALGVDVHKWWEEYNGVVIIPRIEYLENLLWVWGLGYENKLTSGNVNTTYLEREIMKQASYIYVNISGISPYTLWCAYKMKFGKEIFEPSERYMESICPAPNQSDQQNVDCSQLQGSYEDDVLCHRISPYYKVVWTKEKLLHAYHCKCYLERMYEVIQVSIHENELSMIQDLQQAMINKLNYKGIVVEVNPTSNLAITSIDSLANHQGFKLNEITKGDKANGLIITINTDDPGTFNASVSNELANMFYILQGKGYSRESILAWIDKVREWGIETSFISSREIGIEQQKEEIRRILADIG